MSFPHISASTVHRHQPSKNEWDELKSVIRKLYIEEDKKLQYVIDVLKTERGFDLTQRQMTRKLDEWKFKKNTTSAERRSYVHEGGRPGNPPRDGTSGVKVTPAKLERWKKLMAKEGTANEASSTEYRSMSTDRSVPEGSSSFTSVQTQTGISFDNDGDIIMSNVSPGNSPASVDVWPFASNSTDLGPDLLSQLFSTLKITPPEDLSKYPVPDMEDLGSDVEDPDEFQYLSQSQLIALSNGGDTCLDLSLSDSRRPTPNAFFSYSSPSPLTKLYVFPQFTSRKKPSWHTLKAPLETETSIRNERVVMWKHMLAKFQQAGLAKNPALITIIRGLAREYRSLGKYASAEKWLRRAIIANKQFGEGSCYENVEDNLILASTLIRNGNCVQARKLLDQIFPSVKHYDTSHLQLLSLYLREATLAAFSLKDIEKGLAYSHEQLQIELSYSGPWNIQVINASEDIARILNTQGKFNEALDLFSITLQLQERAIDVHAADRCFTLSSLASVLRLMGRHSESITVAEQAMALGKNFLGYEDLSTLNATSELATSLLAGGFQVRSESLHREILAKFVSLLGRNATRTISATTHLCEFLIQSNRLLEALSILSQAFYENIDGLRQLNSRIIECGNLLVYCYINQRRLSDARLVYKQMLEAFSDEKELAHEHWVTISWKLGGLYEDEDLYVDAIALYEETLQFIQQYKGHSHPDAIEFSCRLARSFESERRFSNAIALYEETLQLIQDCSERYEYDVIKWFNWQLARCYRKAKRYLDAVAVYELMIRTTQTTTNDADEILYWCDDLGLCYEEQGEYARAIEVYQHIMHHIIETEGEEHPAIANLKIWIEEANDLLFEAIEEANASLFEEFLNDEMSSLYQNSSTTEEEEEEEEEVETKNISTGKEEVESQYQFVYEV